MAQVLRQLETPHHPNLLVGTEHFDDAGVYRLSDSLALVQTVDFFPPLVDDPYTFGRIAAANSLSDVYAMGGTPLTALNIVGFPDKELPVEILVEILRGGAERVAAAGAVIVGGHSVRDAEVKYGLAVTGTIHPDRIVTNAGAQPGDQLVLTKPLGSGVLTSAVKSGKMPAVDLAECIEVMMALNRSAAEIMQQVGVDAATDITGFGLLGHAFEMAEASRVTLVIDPASVPLLTGTLQQAQAGVLTRAHQSTLAYLGDKLDPGSTDPVLIGVLADAQTSGGLLIAVSSQKCERLTTLLAGAGVICSTIVGRVTSRSPRAIVLKSAGGT